MSEKRVKQQAFALVTLAALSSNILMTPAVLADPTAPSTHSTTQTTQPNLAQTNQTDPASALQPLPTSSATQPDSAATSTGSSADSAAAPADSTATSAAATPNDDATSDAQTSADDKTPLADPVLSSSSYEAIAGQKLTLSFPRQSSSGIVYEVINGTRKNVGTVAANATSTTVTVPQTSASTVSYVIEKGSGPGTAWKTTTVDIRIMQGTLTINPITPVHVGDNANIVASVSGISTSASSYTLYRQDGTSVSTNTTGNFNLKMDADKFTHQYYIEASWTNGHKTKCQPFSIPQKDDSVKISNFNDVYLGETATTQVTDVSRPGATYQWYKGSTKLTGQTSTKLSIADVKVSDEGAYHVVATWVDGHQTKTATSNIVNLKVKQGVFLTNPVDTSGFPGDTATFTASTKPNTTIHWEHYVNGSWQALSQTGGTLTIHDLKESDAGKYRASATWNGQPTVYSSEATLTVDPASITNPTDQTAWLGGHANFSVNVTGDPDVTWEHHTSSGWETVGTGTSLDLTDVKKTDAGEYRAKATWTVGDKTKTLTTDAASLTVNEAWLGQPADQIIFNNNYAKFTVQAADGATFQWQKQDADGHWHDIDGATDATMSTKDAGEYRVVANWSADGGTQKISKPAKATKRARDLVISGPGSSLEGSNINIDATVMPERADFQWQKQDSNGEWQDMSGQTDSTLKLTNLSTSDNNAKIRLKATWDVQDAGVSPRGMRSARAAETTTETSNVYTLQVTDATISGPTDTSTTVGGSASFSVTTTPSASTYQWQVEQPGGTWQNIQGATSSQLNLENLGESANGNQYRVIAGWDNGLTKTSSTASLTVTSNGNGGNGGNGGNTNNGGNNGTSTGTNDPNNGGMTNGGMLNNGTGTTSSSAMSGLIKTSAQIGMNRSAGVNNWLNGIQNMNPNETATEIHNGSLPNTGTTPLHQMIALTMTSILASAGLLIKFLKRRN